MSYKPLIMLSPPRSFSSVVSTMIGEHPEIYGFPELHLFVGDTIKELIDREYENNNRHVAGPPGLIRAIAQLHDGLQTTGAAIRAIGWINENHAMSTQKLMDYLLEKVAPKVGLEKSPITAHKARYMERAYTFYPDAYYLHLTRHPLPVRASWTEFVENKSSAFKDGGKRERIDRLVAWHHMHANILEFTSTLPLGQTLRIKGEDILSEPYVYLPQVCEWLGVRTDKAAIDAMLHPENSPYASIGPDVARGGNDPKFMRSPKLRGGRVKEPSLEKFFETEQPEYFPEGNLREAASRSGLKIGTSDRIADHISHMSNLLGYV